MNAKEYRRHLRRELTPAERILWMVLRARRFRHLKVRRQHSLDKYVVDFYIPSCKLVIELDGEIHLNPGQEQYDQQRDITLTMLGCRVLRFRNQDIYYHLDSVLDRIAEMVYRKTAIENRPL